MDYEYHYHVYGGLRLAPRWGVRRYHGEAISFRYIVQNNSCSSFTYRVLLLNLSIGYLNY